MWYTNCFRSFFSPVVKKDIQGKPLLIFCSIQLLYLIISIYLELLLIGYKKQIIVYACRKVALLLLNKYAVCSRHNTATKIMAVCQYGIHFPWPLMSKQLSLRVRQWSSLVTPKIFFLNQCINSFACKLCQLTTSVRFKLSQRNPKAHPGSTTDINWMLHVL